MNAKELKAFRAGLDEDTLRFMATVYMFELHGLPIFFEYNRVARLTPKGRELAEILVEEEPYQNYALERFDLAQKDSSRVDLQH